MIVYLENKNIEGFIEIGRITKKILDIIIDKTKPGVSTLQLDEIAIEECKKNNVNPVFLNYNGFPSAICTSINNILVHGIPDNTILKDGDIITIDFGAEKDGFIGDSAKTIGINCEYDIISCCEKALYDAIKVARSGNTLNDISSVIFSNKSDYSVPMLYGGHGINRFKLHASPFIPNYPTYDDFTLRSGMILAIEPMFINGDPTTYVLNDKWSVKTNYLSAHFEHTILITENDPIILTGN